MPAWTFAPRIGTDEAVWEVGRASGMPVGRRLRPFGDPSATLRGYCCAIYSPCYTLKPVLGRFLLRGLVFVDLGRLPGCSWGCGRPNALEGDFIPERNFRASDRTRVNERIRAREIRVIDEDGAQLGVMQPFEAMKLARERGLDLVEISPTADPPVCKITDYGKYQYQQNKKAHEQRKSSRGTQLKEVKFRPNTAEHDYQVRKNQIIRFLGDGHKVRAMIFHRGREMAHQEVGRAKMERLLLEIGDQGQIETSPRMEGNVLVALLAPKKGTAATRSTGQAVSGAQQAP